MYCAFCASSEMIEKEYEIHLLKYHKDKFDSKLESICSVIDTIDNDKPPRYELIDFNKNNNSDTEKNIKKIIIAEVA